MLSATERLQAFNVMHLIRQRGYFILHAPRQVGKTTAMLELARLLTASGEYISVLLSCEVGAPFSADIESAESAIISTWHNAIRSQLPPDLRPPEWMDNVRGGGMINRFLSDWSFAASRPLVIFLDEIDALQDNALISVLRQLRAGYPHRPEGFPASLALIGLRDVRDYKVKSGGSSRLKSPSPFNIAVRSITLRNFTEPEVIRLLQQHTKATGQQFTENALAHVFYLTQGQPWLVNSLAKLCVEELVTDLAQPVEIEQVNAAKEILIQRRQTHLDSLADKLSEPRVRKIIEPILSGGTMEHIPQDDRDYAVDLGLVRRINGGTLTIANPIYSEIIPRSLASGASDSLPTLQPSWLNPDGSLDADNLLEAFLSFWRQHGQPLLRTAPYHEIAPHLVMMAFLHRVANGGGFLDREYAIGSGRMDLLLRFNEQRLAFELKVWRDGKKDPLARGLVQLDRYLSGLGLETGWLVIFDQRKGQLPIDERTSAEITQTPSGRTITLVRA